MALLPWTIGDCVLLLWSYLIDYICSTCFYFCLNFRDSLYFPCFFCLSSLSIILIMLDNCKGPHLTYLCPQITRSAAPPCFAFSSLRVCWVSCKPKVVIIWPLNLHIYLLNFQTYHSSHYLQCYNCTYECIMLRRWI